MFRTMRRIKNRLEDAEAKMLLENGRRGVLAVNGDDGYPYAVPVNYFYEPAVGKIYFHGAKEGHKADSLRRNDKVCFTVIGNERPAEGDWASTVESAVVFGRCALVTDETVLREKLLRIAYKYYPDKNDAEKELEAGVTHAQVFEISVEHMSGKKVLEK